MIEQAHNKHDILKTSLGGLKLQKQAGNNNKVFLKYYLIDKSFLKNDKVSIGKIFNAFGKKSFLCTDKLQGTKQSTSCVIYSNCLKEIIHFPLGTSCATSHLML